MTFGAKFAVNRSDHDNTYAVGSLETEEAIGFTVGGTVDFKISDLVSIRTGVQYAAKGSETPVPSGTAESDNIFVEIPVLARFGLAQGKAYAAAGMNFGFLTTAEVALPGAGTLDVKDGMKTLNVELVVGAGGVFELGRGKLSVGVQYDLGLTDLSDWSDAEVATGKYPSETKSRNLAFVVGYTF